MNKLIISIISSFLFIFLLWGIQAYSMFGEDMNNYHIDIKRTIENFDRDYFVEDVIGNIEKMQNYFTQNTDLPDNLFGNFVNMATFLCSLLINVIPLLLALVIDLISFILMILDFIFAPKFIKII